ncbi:MAG: NTP transferase domain-containing protein, partial [Xanthomonadales bacterium]|nr:NTP transferase domain-containing protein [Xanthomonadales bacterium]
MKLLILAAGMGTRLKPLTDDKPKVLTELNGKTLLQRQLDTAHEAGVHDVVLIGGYLADQLRGFGAELVINEDYATTNMVQSLFCARSHFGNDFIMSYGDIV